MAAPCGDIDHSYCSSKSIDRCSSIFRPDGPDGDHTYIYSTPKNFNSTPKKSCKRPRGTPTGKTPQQPVKSSKAAHIHKFSSAIEHYNEAFKKSIQTLKKHQQNALDSLLNGNDCICCLPTGYGKSLVYEGLKTHTPWSEEEKQFFISYVETTRGKETLASYWRTCADVLSSKFPDHSRNGIACKSLSQRLFVAPSGSNQTDELSFTSIEHDITLDNTVDIATQTDLTFPVTYDRHNLSEPAVGDWVFMEPKKQLKEGATKAAEILHLSALKRMRQFPNLNPNERAHLIQILCTSTSNEIAREILTTSLGQHIQLSLLNDIELEARDCATHSSILHQKQYKNLSEFSWDKILEELSTKHTFLCEVLLAVALPTGKVGNLKATESAVPDIGSIYGMLMKERFHKLSRLQRVVSMCLANEQVSQKFSIIVFHEVQSLRDMFSREVYDRLQPMGVTMSHDGMLETMTTISGSFNEAVIDAVKEGKRFRLVGDNINFNVSVTHERKSTHKSSHMEHWFGSIAIIQNVNFPDCSTIAPQCNLLDLPVESFLMNNLDWQLVTNDFKILIARTLTDFLSCLKFAKDAVYQAIPGDTPVDMKKKNQVIPLSVMNKNEQKYAEVIDILDYYQSFCESTYHSCGEEVPRIQVGGDQLTRERFYGAKRLRAAAFSSSERFENLSPITFELFQLQMTVLSMFYDILYNSRNTEVYTLHSQKIRLMRKDADGANVKNKYDSCKELAVSFIRAYIVEAACHFWNMSSTTDTPDWIPDHKDMTDGEIKSWLLHLIEPVINFITSDSKAHMNGDSIDDISSDPMKNYGKVVLELGLIFLNLSDIIKHPSRVRLLCLLKYIMLMLKGHRNKSKYALEILRLLCQQFSLLSEKEACESLFGLFVNTGKAIIPADLQMEFIVKLTKGHLKSMCSNKTENSLIKRSNAFFGMDQIANNFDNQTHVIKRAQRHKKPSSHDDEMKIVSDLHKVQPFMDSHVQNTASVLKVAKSPVKKVSMADIKSWISYHKNLMYYEF